MNSELSKVLRRLKPDKWVAPIKRRELSELPVIGRGSNLPSKLLFDTTVYLDVLQDRFPAQGDAILRSAEAWHSTVVAAELAALHGVLDPSHIGTKKVLDQLDSTLSKMPLYRTIAPDLSIWLEASILTGGLARIQGYAPADRRRLLNDALLFATARKHGLTVFTRNTSDFDLLQQLDPSGRILFYERA